MIAAIPRRRISRRDASRILSRLLVAQSIALSVFMVGCGEPEATTTSRQGDPPTKPAPKSAKSTPAKSQTPGRDAKPSETKPKPKPKPAPPRDVPIVPTKPQAEREPATKGRPPRDPAANAAPSPVEDEAAMRAGLRKITGQHLTLYTDLPAAAAIDELPRVFAAAVPLWCEYFGVDPARAATWQVRGSVIRDKETFSRLGLLPGDLPAFLHGYARSNELWLYDMPSNYYRRHLLLHEGTHAFMLDQFRAAGPPWYMEGVAELLGTHRWDGRKLEMNVLPKNKDDVPEWGRIKLVRDDVAAGRGLSLGQVLSYDRRAHLQTAAYGWSWAAAAFLDGHPRYRQRFRGLFREVARDDADFNVHFRRVFKEDLEAIAEEWQLFAASLEYGHDLERTVIVFAPGKPVPATGATATIRADRGWQSSAIRVEAGKRYRVTASGRFQIADRPKIWWCEPNGVSIRYYQGQPLGVLLAAVRPDNATAHAITAFLKPHVLGLGTEIKPPLAGTLYFRVNESPAEIADNAGTIKVEVREP